MAKSNYFVLFADHGVQIVGKVKVKQKREHFSEHCFRAEEESVLLTPMKTEPFSVTSRKLR